MYISYMYTYINIYIGIPYWLFPFAYCLLPEARVQFLRWHIGGMAEVQTSAETDLSQFLLTRCGDGALTAALPLRRFPAICNRQ